jgi:hypothetical protein
VIVGGANNSITGGNTNGFIGGGRFNSIGANKVFAMVLGGERNAVNGNYSGAIGSSNTVNGNRSFAIGAGITVDSADMVKMGSINLGASKVRIEAATNATVGGLIIGASTPIASAGASETNLISVTIPPHTLTNTQDRATFRTTGRFGATANAKEIKVYLGSEVILATGSQIVNSGAWTIEGEIIRTGNTSQSVNAEFHGAGVTLFTTASSIDLAQTNGINTALKVTGTAAGDGDITNRTMTVWLWPAP